jgi:hypothetical protein
MLDKLSPRITGQKGAQAREVVAVTACHDGVVPCKRETPGKHIAHRAFHKTSSNGWRWSLRFIANVSGMKRFQVERIKHEH